MLVLTAGFVLSAPLGEALFGATTLGMVIWPLIVATVLLFILLAVTGFSSVAAAQDIDTSIAGYNASGGLVLAANLGICLASLAVVSIILAPIVVGLTTIIGASATYATTLLIAMLVALIWTASSVAMALLLEERLWHSDAYD